MQWFKFLCISTVIQLLDYALSFFFFFFLIIWFWIWITNLNLARVTVLSWCLILFPCLESVSHSPCSCHILLIRIFNYWHILAYSRYWSAGVFLAYEDIITLNSWNILCIPLTFLKTIAYLNKLFCKWANPYLMNESMLNE